MPLEDHSGQLSGNFQENAKLLLKERIKNISDVKELAGIEQCKLAQRASTREKATALQKTREERVETHIRSKLTKPALELKLDGPGRPMSNQDYQRLKPAAVAQIRKDDARVLRVARQEARAKVEDRVTAAERAQQRAREVAERLKRKPPGDDPPKPKHTHSRS